jgi:hypothetical protein
VLVKQATWKILPYFVKDAVIVSGGSDVLGVAFPAGLDELSSHGPATNGKSLSGLGDPSVNESDHLPSRDFGH